jgi:hypothetical protein
MSQFYAQAIDESRCRHSLISKMPIMITGLTTEGKIRAFAGIVQSVETGHTVHPGYPLLVTIPDSN